MITKKFVVNGYSGHVFVFFIFLIWLVIWLIDEWCQKKAAPAEMDKQQDEDNTN